MHIAILTGDQVMIDAIHAENVNLFTKGDVLGLTYAELRCRLPVTEGSSLTSILGTVLSPSHMLTL